MNEQLGELIRVGLRNPIKIMVKVENNVLNKEQKIPAKYFF